MSDPIVEIPTESIWMKVWKNIKFVLLAILAIFIAILTLGNLDEIKKRLGLVPMPGPPDPKEPEKPEPVEEPTNYVAKNEEEVEDASANTDSKSTDELISDINSKYD